MFAWSLLIINLSKNHLNEGVLLAVFLWKRLDSTHIVVEDKISNSIRSCRNRSNATSVVVFFCVVFTVSILVTTIILLLFFLFLFFLVSLICTKSSNAYVSFYFDPTKVIPVNPIYTVLQILQLEINSSYFFDKSY